MRLPISVLMPGDPLRAKWIAETFLDKAYCYSNIRGMLGYTGEFKGQRISIQGSGMGIPSAMIYYHELINDYRCETNNPGRYCRVLSGEC